jgi:hypothetical protein
MLGIPLAMTLLLAAGAAPVQATASSGGRYFPLTPARILDTRSGLGVSSGLAQGSSVNLIVVGRGGVPAGAAAVVLNVTVTNPATAGYLTVWPAGGPLPLASNLNFTAGQTVPNLVEVGIGAGGEVSIYASTSLDVIADVQGWVNAIPAGPDGRFHPLVPARLLDTRTGQGGSTLGAGGVVSVTVLGRASVPFSGVSAVVLNVTVTNPTNYGYLTAWPHGVPRPLASNLNFGPGQTVANRALVGVGQGGQVDLFNPGGSVDVVVDINGWFTDGSGSTGALFFGVVPTRILDTRNTGSPLQAGGVMEVPVAGRGGVPAMGGADAPSAVVANVTVTNTSAASFLTVWPAGSALPLASDLNWTPSVTVPNLVVVALGPSGQIDVYNFAGSTDVVIDVVGYYVEPSPPVGSPPTHFGTLAPGSALPTGAQCAAWVRALPVAENKGVNQTANHVTGQSVGTALLAGDDPSANQWIAPRIDGQFTGTTHEILRWVACKWGIDEDLVAAQAAIESWWHQTALGDFGTDPARCPPGHGLGVDGTPNKCPESYGILQNRYPYEQSTWPAIGSSTAGNADTAYGIWRACFEGYESWLNTVDRGSQYAAGDAWGCIGRWYSGRWHTTAAEGYITNVNGYLSSRIWETPNFQEP